jgi:hypothetical protein
MSAGKSMMVSTGLYHPQMLYTIKSDLKAAPGKVHNESNGGCCGLVFVLDDKVMYPHHVWVREPVQDGHFALDMSQVPRVVVFGLQRDEFDGDLILLTLLTELLGDTQCLKY